MEPIATPVPVPGDDPNAVPPAVLGELIVGNGRLIGTRRALTAPLTLIGEGSGCDVRLHSEKVAPFHCALFHGPHGFVLRHLGTPDGTLVNGEPVETTPLNHGDRIEIGPFHLVLELPDGGQAAEAASEDAQEAERDALRVQAAAVVAQQAALTEEELRLQQRRTGLERQEEQLADHLEEKRQDLVDLREQLRTERDAFKEDRANQERDLAARRAEAEKVFAEADAERKLSQKERARFIELRKRLKQRWEQHFTAHEAELCRRQKELDAAAERLRSEAANLERERAVTAQQRRQYNGEMELGRRQLNEAWEELSLSQQEWEVCLNREKTDYGEREQKLAERERQLAHAEQELAADQRSREQVKAQREKEAEGLELRIRNQRMKLQTLERTLANLGAAKPAAVLALPPTLTEPPTPAHHEPGEAPVALKRLAGCLADQRLHLLEQWRGVLELQDHWQKQRESVLAELEDSGHRLAERERLNAEREQQLITWSAQLEQRQEMLSQLRCTLEGWQARLTTGAQEWETERGRVLVAAQAREESAAARVVRLKKLCRRLLKRQRAETAILLAARARCEETRKHYAVLWEECRTRNDTLLIEQQTLASETLAVEQLRLEIVGKAENAAAAEKRLDKLRRQNQELLHRAEAELQRERLALQSEVDRLQERGQALQQDEDHVLAWRRELTRRQVRWNQRMSEAADTELNRLQEMQQLLAQHEQDAKQLQELRDEVERLARLMMDETGDGEAPTTRAA